MKKIIDLHVANISSEVLCYEKSAQTTTTKTYLSRLRF